MLNTVLWGNLSMPYSTIIGNGHNGNKMRNISKFVFIVVASFALQLRSEQINTKLVQLPEGSAGVGFDDQKEKQYQMDVAHDGKIISSVTSGSSVKYYYRSDYQTRLCAIRIMAD
jgi:hypothetical protein